jgi:hypothetical protein
MTDRYAKDRPILRLAHEKIDDFLSNIEKYPRLLPHEAELRKLRDRLAGLVAPAPSDLEMHTRVLDSISALIDEAVTMPTEIKGCVGMTVLSYLAEQVAHFHYIKQNRPLTDEEQHFCRVKLDRLFDRINEVLRPERSGM